MGYHLKKKGIYQLSNDTKYSDDYVPTREIARPVINHTRVSKLFIGVCIHHIYLHHIIFPLLELKTRYTSLSHSCKWILAVIIANDNILVMLWNRYIWWCWHFTSYKIFLLTWSFLILAIVQKLLMIRDSELFSLWTWQTMVWNIMPTVVFYSCFVMWRSHISYNCTDKHQCLLR